MNVGSVSRPAALASAVTVVSLILPATATGQRAAADPAEQTAPVSLGEAIRRASETHPSIRASEAGTEAARARLDRAQADWWPDLSLVGSATQYQKPMVVHPIHGFTPGETPPFDETLLQGGARLDYTLFGDGRPGRIRSARATAAASRAGTRATSADVASEVSAAYLAALTRGWRRSRRSWSGPAISTRWGRRPGCR